MIFVLVARIMNQVEVILDTVHAQDQDPRQIVDIEADHPLLKIENQIHIVKRMNPRNIQNMIQIQIFLQIQINK